jgi:hypothetical protein
MRASPYLTTRRRFLQLGTLALASLAAACAPPRPVATPPSQSVPPTASAGSEPAAVPSPGPRGKLWVLQKRDFLPSLNAWFQEALVQYGRNSPVVTSLRTDLLISRIVWSR